MRQPLTLSVTLPITLIVQPARTTRLGGAEYTSNPRAFYKCDEFAAKVAAAAGLGVPVQEGSLAEAPAEGFLLVVESGELHAHPELGPRIVLLEASRSEVWGDRLTDRFSLAAALEAGGGFHGLQSVAERAGMQVITGHPASRYRALLCPGHCKSWPELLVHYLSVYEEMGLHRRSAGAP
jgi:hypothetical protein